MSLKVVLCNGNMIPKQAISSKCADMMLFLYDCSSWVKVQNFKNPEL